MADHTDVVARVKADLVARGLNLSGPCGAFEITRRVLWELRAEGWGYLAAPPGGENCNGFRTDKGVRPGGTFVDCLVDAGGANTPSWQERVATPDEVAAFRPLVDPGDMPDPAPAWPDEPTPTPQPELLTELQAIVAALQADTVGETTLQASVDRLNDTIAKLQASGLRIHF